MSHQSSLEPHKMVCDFIEEHDALDYDFEPDAAKKGCFALKAYTTSVSFKIYYTPEQVFSRTELIASTSYGQYPEDCYQRLHADLYAALNALVHHFYMKGIETKTPNSIRFITDD